MLLPFQGEYMQLNMNPGVPLRSAPGYVLVAPAGRVLPGHVHPKQVLPMFGRLCSLILLTNLYINKANHNYPFSIFNSQLIISNVFADKI